MVTSPQVGLRLLAKPGVTFESAQGENWGRKALFPLLSQFRSLFLPQDREGRSAGSFPEQRLVIDPKGEIMCMP